MREFLQTWHIGVGVSRQHDFEALQRLYDHLLPGALLIFDGVPVYVDKNLWPLWPKGSRSHLPESWPGSSG